MKMFQPCPLCGNCGMHRKTQRDGNGVMLKPTRCAAGATPEYTDQDGWICESVTKKKSGKRKVRKNKPWQDRKR